MSDDRQSKLLLLLLSNGQMSVQEIVKSLDSSPATVRRDLSDLEASGQIERLHGSARIATGSQRELAFSARESNQLSAKRSIASAAARFVEPNGAIFLDAGTTVLQLARHIKSMSLPVKVFTNGLAIAHELAHAAHVDVTLIGGRVRSENLSVVGAPAIEMLGSLWFDRLFLGASAIDAEGCITSIDAEEAASNAQMVKRSQSLVVLADQTKLDKRMTHAVGKLGEGDTLISDSAPSDPLATYLDEARISFVQSELGKDRKVNDD